MKILQLLALTVIIAVVLGPSAVVSKKSCLCKVSGDPHYYTFDREVIHFMGTCKYILATNKPGSKLPYFSAEVKNEHRRNKYVSYTRMMDLKLKGVTIRLLPHNKILVNSIKINLPIDNYLGFSAKYSAGWITVTTDWGLYLKFDGNHQIHLRLPISFKNQLTGICGDCNGVKDDLRTKSGEDVSSRKSKYVLIGKSYQICDDSDKPENCVIEQPEETCSSSQVKSCEILSSDLFKKCIKKIGQNLLNENIASCKIDACAYRHQPKIVQSVVCKIAESLANECEDVGIFIDWRKTANCELKCRLNQVYSYKTSTCQPTCTKKSLSCKEYTEGCICKPGYILSGEDCVPTSQCGCMNGKVYMMINEEMYAPNCVSKSICRAGGKMEHIKLNGCQANSKCMIYKYKEMCVCNPGYFLQNNTCTKFVCDKPVDVHFLLGSNSIGKVHFEEMKRFVLSFLDFFTIGLDSVRVSLVTYTASYTLYLRTSDDPKHIVNAVNRAVYKSGNTSTLYYLFNFLNRYKSYMKLRSPVKSHSALVGFVGSKLYYLSQTNALAKKLKTAGFNIYMVGIGKKDVQEQLKDIVSNPSSSNLMLTDSYFNLNNIMTELLKKICSVNSCSNNPCKNGGTCINIASTFTCRCPKKYFGRFCAQVKECHCSAYRYLHYRTFDGQTLHFMGACKYTLAAAKRGTRTRPYFSIDVKNEQRSNTQESYTRSVEVTINSIKIQLLLHRILINSEERTLPVLNYKEFKAFFTVGWVTITTNWGLIVRFDGEHRVTVSLPITFADKLTGICGDCNGKQDDFRTKSGQDVSSEPNKDSLIANSYKNIYGSEESCNATQVVNKQCNSNQRCDIINSSVFKSCVNVVGEELAKQFLESCQIDICGHESDVNMKKVFCQSIEAFVTLCEESGVPVNWRGIADCPKFCPYYETYKYYAQKCQKDCVKQVNCSTYGEGCVCSSSSYMYSGNECVYKKRCGCNINKVYVKLREDIYLPKCKTRQYCQKTGYFKKYSVSCSNHNRCGLKNGKRQCICNDGYYGSTKCYPIRIPTFIYVQQAELKTIPWISFKSVTCFRACLYNKLCKAYNYDYSNKLCELYNVDASGNMTLSPSNCITKSYFQRASKINIVLNGASSSNCGSHFKIVEGIETKELCRSICLSQKCFAFEYIYLKKKCKLMTSYNERFQFTVNEQSDFVGLPSKVST